MVYEVYAGGIHAVQARLNMDYSKPGHYSVKLGAHTRGFLGALAPWDGTFESHGWVLNKNDLRPRQHKSVAIWRGEKEIKDYAYTKDRRFKGLSIKDHDKPAYKKEVDAALTQGTTDVLTATLLVMQDVADGMPCEGASEVFDGKRRFELVFRDQGAESLNASRYNIYEGPARKCSVEVVPVAGDWHKKPRGWMSIQEQGRKRGTIPTVWVASLTEGQPAVPVKIRVKTAFGTLFMHLAEYRSGKDILIAETRAEE